MKASKNNRYFSFVQNLTEDIDPRELRISKSLTSLCNKTSELDERVARLDKLIKEYS
ncbi:MAG: hypothetical protein SFU98_18715 [Leptospiraceae bacterium]|nr:hypothetical protein [Leptospiraceae bacterium]